MATFKIRDLMVAIRPGVQTPQRPKPLEDCDFDFGSIVCDIGPFDSGGGCGDSVVDCDDTCGACTESCGCTDACSVSCPASCTNNSCGDCTLLSCDGNTCTGCSVTCGAASCGCTFTNFSEDCTTPFKNVCARSINAPIIGRMAAGDLATLKAQLRRAMQQVGQREKALAAKAERGAIVPQTLAQVDALEKKLSEAMDELKTRRTEIEKAAKPAGKTAAKPAAKKAAADKK